MSEKEIKEIKKQVSELDKEIKANENQIREIQTMILSKRREVGILNRRLGSISRDDLFISDHATLRLLERRFGQEEIIAKAVEHLKTELRRAKVSANCKIRIDGDLEAVIVDNVLVTVK